ncbi:MAG: GNAT family N-acetyltransferase, partial [Cyanobium sp.]
MFFIDPSSHEIGRSPTSAPAAFTPSVRWGLGIDAEDFRLSPSASSERFSFHLLRPGTPLLAGYWHLRRRIFCQEQHLFETSDRDARDGGATPIAAIAHGANRAGEHQ